MLRGICAWVLAVVIITAIVMALLFSTGLPARLVVVAGMVWLAWRFIFHRGLS